MAITFPLNPVNGVTHIENGITFEYDSTSGSWKKQISIGTLEASTSTFSVTSAVTEEFNRTLGSGVSTNLTLTNNHNDKALVHAKKFVPGADVTDINWDFDTSDASQWNYLTDKIEFVDGKVRLKGVTIGGDVESISSGTNTSFALMTDGTVWCVGRNASGQMGVGTTSGSVTSWVQSNITGVSSISSGGSHSVAIKNDGTAWCCGYNGYGQLGNGDTIEQHSWVQSNITGSIASISCGYYHTMALMSDGTVWGAGSNGDGELGVFNNTSTSSSSWIQSDITGVSSISAHYYVSMALMPDGVLKGVGRNNQGQLGIGNTTSPQRTWVQLLTGVSSVAGGAAYSMAVMTNGSVRGCGYNGNGAIGESVWSSSHLNWVTSNITGVSSISCGDSHTMALKSDNTLWGIGNNSSYQVGTGSTSHQASWVQVLSGVSSISTGSYFSMAFMPDHSVEGAGLNNFGQLGDGTSDSKSWVTSGIQSTSSTSFNEPSGTVDSISSISLANTATINSLAITENKPTGTDIKYALSFDGKTTWRVPAGVITDITTEGVDATTLATYDFTGFTGTSLDIQSYLTTTDTSVSPDIDLITVGLTVNGAYTQVAIDGVTLLAAESGTNTVTVTNGDATEETYNFMVSVDVPETITVDGIVGSAGVDGATGPAGPDGTIPPSHSSTFSVTSAVTEEFNRTLGSGVSTDLTLSNNHNDKALVHAKKFVPGSNVTDINWDFDIGDESQWNFLSDKIEFVDGKVRLKGVETGADISDISCGLYHSMALMTDGTVWTCGWNFYGELGVGNNTQQDFWIASNISGVATIECGEHHTLAIMINGTVKSVGNNDNGQLGIGNTTNKNSWVDSNSGGLTGVSSISGGNMHSMAVLSDGTVKAVGYNGQGGLGLSNTTNQTSWVTSGSAQHGWLSGVSSVSCGHYHSAVVMTDGTMKSTGKNAEGQLGVSTNNQSTFWLTAVTQYGQTVTGIASAACGREHTLIVMTDGTVKATGGGAYGKLGNGGTSDSSYWVDSNSGGLTGVVSVATGENCSWALKSDGTVKAVGRNHRGQLSQGNTTDQSSWVTSSLTGATAMSGGHSFAMVLLLDGTVHGVGDCDEGQLGNGPGEWYWWNWVDTGLQSTMSTSFNEPNGTVDSISSISLVNTATINSLAITENKPAGTDIKYALSFDGKTTWRVPSGAITDITTEGVDATTLATYDFTGFTGTTLDIQSYLTTTDTSVSPDIDLITVGLTVNGTYTQVAIDGVTLLAAESGTNTVTVTNGDATEETYNFMVSVDVPETITVDGIVGAAGSDGTDGAALVNWTEDANGNIIPNTDSAHDIGSAQYKVRDLFVSESSIWVGDQHKIEIDATGKMKIRKRKKNVVPASITNAGGDQAAALTHAGVGAVQDMKMHHWINYMRTIGNPNAGTHDVFDFDNTAEVEPDITLDASDMYTKTEVDTIVSGSGGINTYPTMSNLPLTGVTAGSMAMVLDVNKLYVNNGQGWYFISIINASPSITGGIDSNYILDKYGVPTVITVIADDPEGFPLTYTHSAPALGNTAVITQNNEVFTITPTTNELNGGVFDVTFTASDGVNIASQTTNMILAWPADPSGVIFTAPGTSSKTHLWTVPPGVSSVSVVVIGGGGGQDTTTAPTSSFGGYVIAPGGTNVRAIKSAPPSGSALTSGFRGGAGEGGHPSYGWGSGGGNGGGGGAAGYTSDGGDGTSGGHAGPGGGGVGIYGGTNGGTGGHDGWDDRMYGIGGSGGTNGQGYGSNSSAPEYWQTAGGSYGGGTGSGAGGAKSGGGGGSLGYGNNISVTAGQEISITVGNGGSSGSTGRGVVRVIWGDTSVTRTFPSTNVDAASSVVTETTV